MKHRGRGLALCLGCLLAGAPAMAHADPSPGAPAPEPRATPAPSAPDGTGSTSAEVDDGTAVQQVYEEEAALRAEISDPAALDLDFGQAFLQMLLVLGFICGVAYLLLGKLLPKLLRMDVPAAGGRRLLRVVDRLPIDPKRSLMVVRVGEEHFFVGATEHQIGLIARLDREQVDAALMRSEPEPAMRPLDRIGRMFGRRTEDTI